MAVGLRGAGRRRVPGRRARRAAGAGRPAPRAGAWLASEIERLEVPMAERARSRSSAAASAAWRPASACRRPASHGDVRGARSRRRSRLRLPGPGLHLRRRADRHHRARTAWKSCTRWRASGCRDHVTLDPVRPFYRLRWPDGDALRLRRRRGVDARAGGGAGARDAAGSSGSWTTAARCSRPVTKGWWTPLPALRRHGAGGARAGAAARRSFGLRRRQPVREGRATAPGAVVPRLADRGQSVRDQRHLHADSVPGTQVGRVLSARRHGRAGARAGRAVSAAGRRAASVIAGGATSASMRAASGVRAHW